MERHPIVTLRVAQVPGGAAAHVRRHGRGHERGAVDKAIVSLLFQRGLRRSEAAALRWADVQDATDGRGVRVYVRRPGRRCGGRAAISRTGAPWRFASSATGVPCSAQGCVRSRQIRCSAASTVGRWRAVSPPPGPPASTVGSPGPAGGRLTHPTSSVSGSSRAAPRRARRPLRGAADRRQTHDNQLTGSIPAELGNLPSQVQLQYNQLTGCIPSSSISILYRRRATGRPRA